MFTSILVAWTLAVAPPPPSSAPFESPNATNARFSFRCPGRSPSIDVELAMRFTASGSTLAVSELRNGRYRLGRAALIKASERLSGLYEVQGVRLRCAGGSPSIILVFLGSARSNDGVYVDKQVTIFVDGSTVVDGAERR